MNTCETHGEKSTDWCEECATHLQCDCTEVETHRVKDLHYGCSGDWTVTIYIDYCAHCGDVKGVS